MIFKQFQVVDDLLYALDNEGRLWCLQLNTRGMPRANATWKEIKEVQAGSISIPTTSVPDQF